MPEHATGTPPPEGATLVVSSPLHDGRWHAIYEHGFNETQLVMPKGTKPPKTWTALALHVMTLEIQVLHVPSICLTCTCGWLLELGTQGVSPTDVVTRQVAHLDEYRT
ncbi:hypothetical protein [Amycolatopsis sp. cmx-4-83]|uniref:hypothetical protein n=1 Tax=Amycolatopsis sp. cmx-4-83 TaxID=2790940 RepID=UPI00397D078C